jgi:transposase InsO family protein
VPPRSETHATYGFPDEAARTEEHFPQLAADDPPAPSCSLIQRHCAAAESLNSLYKKELIEREGPWRGTDDVMLATLEWVDWYNTERLHSACKYIPPKEYEENYYARQERMVS